MSENKNYSQKKIIYNPTIFSIVLLILAIAFIYLLFKSEGLRNSLIQFAENFNDFMSKHL
jgi:hypothetical protein